jgi:hypothetical protein
MAGRGDRLLKKFAEALALGIAPVRAAEMAGYPRGRSDKTYSANARKRPVPVTCTAEIKFMRDVAKAE